MGTVKHFHGQTELTGIIAMSNREFAVKFPGVKGRRYDGYSMMVGRPAGEAPVWDGTKWASTILPVQRVITFKSNPSRHECDARCMNASGRTMNCECSCGGRNHGRGSFVCEAA